MATFVISSRACDRILRYVAFTCSPTLELTELVVRMQVQRIKNDFTCSVYEIHGRIALEKVRFGYIPSQQ